MGIPDVRTVSSTGRGQHGQLAHLLGQAGLVAHVIEQGNGSAGHLGAVFQYRHWSSANATRARADFVKDAPQVLTHAIASHQGYTSHHVLLTHWPGGGLSAG